MIRFLDGMSVEAAAWFAFAAVLAGIALGAVVCQLAAMAIRVIRNRRARRFTAQADQALSLLDDLRQEPKKDGRR
ncbi:hypothetical protein ACQP1V_36380 [Microtetraspora malaysiensis]|uniref:hypothetical protein n=1 Tax=Microtetraspora malaysiensis TaxID=161358 RepID=UPI003D941B66